MIPPHVISHNFWWWSSIENLLHEIIIITFWFSYQSENFHTTFLHCRKIFYDWTTTAFAEPLTTYRKKNRSFVSSRWRHIGYLVSLAFLFRVSSTCALGEISRVENHKKVSFISRFSFGMNSTFFDISCQHYMQVSHYVTHFVHPSFLLSSSVSSVFLSSY